jgi:Alanyl-tRNA synthetase
VILKVTPFYAESGGQVGDSGKIFSKQGCFEVNDTKKLGNSYLHYGAVTSGKLNENQLVTATIDTGKREAIRRNHSAVHLLHQSLKLILRQDVSQNGSFVDEQKLRLDFNYHAPLSDSQLCEIELLVNSKILDNLTNKTVIKPLEEAVAEGACALFEERYQEMVRVVSLGDFSCELCGGTHVESTGEIGLFKVISETGIAAGIRRIEATTGKSALVGIHRLESNFKEIANLVGAGNMELAVDKVRKLLFERQELEQKLHHLQQEKNLNDCRNLVSSATEFEGGRLLLAVITTESSDLRQMTDTLKKLLDPAVVVLASVRESKTQLAVGVSDCLTKKIQANQLLNYLLAELGGKGGGKAGLAQGVAETDLISLKEAFKLVEPWLENRVIKK